MSGRNIIVFLLAVAASMASFAVPATGTAVGDQEAVLQTVHMLLDGWREADASKLEAALHPDFREVTLHLQDGKWNFAVEERDRLIETMGHISKGAWDDQLIDPPDPRRRTNSRGVVALQIHRAIQRTAWPTRRCTVASRRSNFTALNPVGKSSTLPIRMRIVVSEDGPPPD